MDGLQSGWTQIDNVLAVVQAAPALELAVLFGSAKAFLGDTVMCRPTVGATVQTPFGKGTVLGVRNRDRYLVQVKGRALLLRESDLTPVEDRKTRADRETRVSAVVENVQAGRERDAPVDRYMPSVHDCDLHGCTVDAALLRIDEVLNDALLRGLDAVRFIHGRSGGRLKRALHLRLRELPSVKSFRVEAANAGVTIVKL